MSNKHGGISRLAVVGDVGRVHGWGLLGNDAMLNIELDDLTMVCIPMPPLWASELFYSSMDKRVRVVQGSFEWLGISGVA